MSTAVYHTAIYDFSHLFTAFKQERNPECSLITCISQGLQFHLLTSLLLLRTFIWPNRFPDRKLAHTSCHKPTWEEPIAPPDDTLTVIKLPLILLCKTTGGLEVPC